MNHLLPQVLLVGLNIEPRFLILPRVSSVMDMVASVLASHTILIRSLLDILSWYQLFHRTTLFISVIFPSMNYFVLLPYVDIEFP